MADRVTQLGGRGVNWVFVSGEASSGYSGTFDAAPSVIVNHNLGRKPACVRVRTSGGLEVDVACHDLNNNQLALYFDVPMAGSVEIS